MKQHNFNLLLTVLFCLFIGGMFLGSLILPDREFSQLENRNLEQAPEVSLENITTGKFMEDAEDYVNDQIIGRDFWVALKAWSEHLSGKQENNGVYFAKEDTLISRVDTPEQSTLDTNAGYVNALVDNVDVPVYFGIIPSAAEIWSDRLPEGAPTADEKAIIDRLYNAVQTHTIDLYSALAQHKDEGLYYRTDHHWTSLGAYYGYTALMEALGVEPEPLGEKTTVSQDFNGTLYSTSGVHWLESDEIDTYIPDEGVTVTVNDGVSESTHGLYVEENLVGKDKYTFFMGGNNPLYIVKSENAATDEKLLLVRDSYSDSLIPYLTQYYSEIHVIDLRYYRVPVAAYAESMGADSIFVCYSIENFQKEDNVIFLGQ